MWGIILKALSGYLQYGHFVKNYGVFDNFKWNDSLKNKHLITGLLIVFLGGCTSSNITEVKPVEFSSENSVALNIANQTFLTQDYWYGKTIKSPLRDFSPEEIDAVKTQLTKKSGAGFHLVMGLIDFARLDLTSAAISTTTAGLAHLSNSQHIASHGHWIVAIDATDFNDGTEAKSYVTNLIRETAIKQLESKGNTLHKVFLRHEGQATFGGKIYEETFYTINGYKFGYGLFFSEFQYDKTPFAKGKTNLINAEEQYVTVSSSPVMAGIANFPVFLDGHVKGYEGLEGFEQFLIDVTNQLPKGYFLYMPSFPSGQTLTLESNNAEEWSCLSCRDSKLWRLNAFVVPRIYTEGKKYEFIKPN